MSDKLTELTARFNALVDGLRTKSVYVPQVALPNVSIGVSKHSELTGLATDDHAQYLDTTRHDTTLRHGSLVVDHGGIGGLGDNDHPHYRNLLDEQILPSDVASIVLAGDDPTEFPYLIQVGGSTSAGMNISLYLDKTYTATEYYTQGFKLTAGQPTTPTWQNANNAIIGSVAMANTYFSIKAHILRLLGGFHFAHVVFQTGVGDYWNMSLTKLSACADKEFKFVTSTGNFKAGTIATLIRLKEY